MQDVSKQNLSDVDKQLPAKLPALLLLGMPGAGKGTQGSLLGAMPGLFHFSTGEILRSLPPGDADYELVHSHIDGGNFVPDADMIPIWKRWLGRQIEAGHIRPEQDIMVLDGLPRTVEQCGMLADHIDVLGIIHLDASHDEPLVERLLNRAKISGRPDDSSEAIVRHRFEVYRQVTQPILDKFPSDIVYRIDPLGTPTEVKQRILERLNPTLRRFQQAQALV